METKPRSRFARLALATLAGTLAIGGVAVTVAHAETGIDDAATIQALGAAKLTLADAIRAAEATGQGTITGTEFEIKDGKPAFDVTTQSGLAETDHRIDPVTGTILASTPNADDADDGDTETDEAAELTALHGAKVSLLQAIASAEGQGGTVVSAEYGQEDGALAIEVGVADASGKVAEMMVDATTGKVMATDSDAGNEDGENGVGSEEQQG